MVALELLKTARLCKSYGGLHAVSEVDFAIQQGEVRAIIGPNGAGKTTFVSLLSGRILPNSGQIYFNGDDVTALPAWRRVREGIAYTFQITSIYPNLSVYENVAIAAQGLVLAQPKNGEDKAQLVEQIVSRCISQVGLDGREQTQSSQLAYGHQRLLEISMGLALNPRLLILDEPTQGLSDSEIDEFIQLIKQVRNDTTVLLIEHNMSVVMALADRITVLDQGRVLAEGSPADIRRNPAVQTAYLGG